MFKKTIKFTDFNGNEVEEDFYFHMSKAELLEMAATGDMQERINRMIASKDNSEILREFKKIITASVGIRSEDGRAFIKNDEAKARFMFSPAYDELLFELISNANAASEFIRNLIPEKMQSEMKKEMEKIKSPFVETDKRVHSSDDTRPAYMRENRKPTHEEMQNMNRDEFLEAWKHFNE